MHGMTSDQKENVLIPFFSKKPNILGKKIKQTNNWKGVKNKGLRTKEKLALV